MSVYYRYYSDREYDEMINKVSNLANAPERCKYTGETNCDECRLYIENSCPALEDEEEES